MQTIASFRVRRVMSLQEAQAKVIGAVQNLKFACIVKFPRHRRQLFKKPLLSHCEQNFKLKLGFPAPLFRAFGIHPFALLDHSAFPQRALRVLSPAQSFYV